jgi:hypothetical protein
MTGFGVDFNAFWHAFLIFVAAYFGTKHGTSGNQ